MKLAEVKNSEAVIIQSWCKKLELLFAEMHNPKEENKDAEIDTIEIEIEVKEDAEMDTIEIEAEEIKLIEEENFAENIAENETANKRIFNQQIGQITHKTNTPKFDQNLILEEPAPMGYLKKEDLEEENLIEKDDSEDERTAETKKKKKMLKLIL